MIFGLDFGLSCCLYRLWNTSLAAVVNWVQWSALAMEPWNALVAMVEHFDLDCSCFGPWRCMWNFVIGVEWWNLIWKLRLSWNWCIMEIESIANDYRIKWYMYCSFTMSWSWMDWKIKLKWDCLSFELCLWDFDSDFWNWRLYGHWIALANSSMMEMNVGNEHELKNGNVWFETGLWCLNDLNE